jgi:macrolide transport system ATP-binding/permease protein
MLLRVSHLSKSYGAANVLDDVSFVVNRDERAGLVGPNGVGKSTLLRILAGQGDADGGEFAFGTSVEFGYLPQTTPEFPGRTIEDLIRESTGGLRRLEARMRELEVAMAAAGGEELPALLDEYGTVSTRFQDRGGYELDHRIDDVLAGLRIAYLPRDRDVRTLSGGERARVGLAALLLRAPDLLLLDEPTNHLDAATLEWLELFLVGYPGAALIVSHDRWFLNRTVNRIFEIDEYTHAMKRYEGDYDAYATAKAQERRKWEEDYERQQEEMQELRRRIKQSAREVAHNRKPTDNDKMAYNFFGENVAKSVSSRVRDAEARLARLEADPVPKPPKPMRFQPHFNGEQMQSKAVLTATGLTKRHGERELLRDVGFVLPPDARIVLTGPNGAGKTTLLKLLLGLEAPDAGAVRTAPSVRLGYLPQDPPAWNAARTVLETYRDGMVGPEGTIVASLLGNGLFRLEDLPKTVGQLSVGQRRKLEIVRLVAERPNVLLLDEPTNHISLDVLDALEAAVYAFPGPVLAVSHDRWFIQRFGGAVWELDNGVLRC